MLSNENIKLSCSLGHYMMGTFVLVPDRKTWTPTGKFCEYYLCLKESATSAEGQVPFSGGDAVPAIFCGSVCTSSSPKKRNEADTRLVLRMAMTGASTSVAHKDGRHDVDQHFNCVGVENFLFIIIVP